LGRHREIAEPVVEALMFGGLGSAIMRLSARAGH